MKTILNKFISKFLYWLAKRMSEIPVIFGEESRVLISNEARLANAILNVQSGTITIEEFVVFGHNVSILTGTHDILKQGRLRRDTVPKTGRDIMIHRGCWLCSNVTVIGPCEIGENAIVLPFSLVNSNIEPNSIYGGIPAKLIRMQ